MTSRTKTVMVEPNVLMLLAAQYWSHGKYGKPIGNDAARGCWAAMLAHADADDNLPQQFSEETLELLAEWDASCEPQAPPVRPGTWDRLVNNLLRDGRAYVTRQKEAAKAKEETSNGQS